MRNQALLESFTGYAKTIRKCTLKVIINFQSYKKGSYFSQILKVISYFKIKSTNPAWQITS